MKCVLGMHLIVMETDKLRAIDTLFLVNCCSAECVHLIQATLRSHTGFWSKMCEWAAPVYCEWPISSFVLSGLFLMLHWRHSVSSTQKQRGTSEEPLFIHWTRSSRSALVFLTSGGGIYKHDGGRFHPKACYKSQNLRITPKHCRCAKRTNRRGFISLLVYLNHI